MKGDLIHNYPGERQKGSPPGENEVAEKKRPDAPRGKKSAARHG